MRIRWIFFGILFILLMTCGNITHAYGGITVIAEPGMNEDVIVLVDKIVTSFNDIVRKEMKVTLSRNVQLFLCPTEESFIQVLRKKFKFSKKDAIAQAKISAGISRPDLAVTAVRFDLRNTRALALSVTAHELAHQLQADLSGNYSGRALRWMEEGTADLIASVIASKCGYESFEKWKLDEINYFRTFGSYASPMEMSYIDLDEWNALILGKKHPYEISELLVFYLMNTTKKNFYEAMAEYFQNASTLKEDFLSFEESFGIPLPQFNDLSQKWLEQTKKEATRFDVVTDAKSSIAQDLEAAFELSQKLMKEEFGDNVHSHQRVITAPEKASYIVVLSNEFGMTQSDAEKAANEGTWRFSTGTTIIEIGSYPDRQQRFYRMGNIMMKKLLSQQASNTLSSSMFWFRNGSAEVFAALLVEQADFAPVDSYRKALRVAIGKAESRPTIEELQTSKQWDSAVEKYGLETVNGYAALACWYLMESKGVDSIVNWINLTKKLHNSKEAFEKNFEMTPKEFENLFEKHLQSLKIP